jgi:hypothetical protein
VKLTGKEGKNALGAIVTEDRRTNFLLPSSEGSSLATTGDKNLSTILRYRRDLFGATTGGFFYTDREGDGYHNRMLGGDVLFRWKRAEAWRVELMGSSTQYPTSISASSGQRSDAFTGYALRTVYQHQSRDWMWWGIYRDVAKGFRADLGFVPQVDFKERGVALEHAWYPAKSAWTQARAGVESSDSADQSGHHLQRHADFYAWANGPRQSFVRLDLTPADQGYRGTTFHTSQAILYGEFQASPDLFVSGQLTAGSQVDFANVQQGRHVRFDPGVRWNAGDHLRLPLDDSFERFNVDACQLFTANLTQLRATYQFNNRTFVRWIGQHLDVRRDAGLYSFPIDERDHNFYNQLLFSYKINPLTVLFLGYSDTYLGDAQTNLTQQNRTLFLKVGYAWQV